MQPSNKLIWFAIAFSTVIYAVILYTAVPRQPEGAFADAVKRPITLVLYVLVLVDFVAAIVVPILKRSRGREKMILAMALFESCAVYGLVAAFIARDWRLYIGPWIVALIGMVREYPSAEYEQIPG